METAFSWLGQMMEWLGKLIPRIIIVKRTHGGVKYVHGHKVVRLDPGLHFYWPIVTEVELHPVARQSVNLPTQVIMTKDRVSFVVGVVSVYEIHDIVAVLSRNWDTDGTVLDITQTAVVEVCAGMTSDELIDKIKTEVKMALTKTTRHFLKPYGIRVKKCAVTDFSICKVFKLVGDQNPLVEGKVIQGL